MEKITRNIEVSFYFNWAYGVSISKIKKDIEELEKLGVTDIDMYIHTEYGDSNIEIQAISNRLETDEEFQKRIDEENKKQEVIKQRELELLANLKSKYGI